MSLYEVPKGYETKMRVVEAVMKCAGKTPISAMTVRDVCRQAGISRQTFYRHFLDKYDVLGWYNQQLYGVLAYRVGKDLTWDEAGQRMLERTRDERSFYAFALKSTEDRNSLLPTVSRLLVESWRENFSQLRGFNLTKRLDYQLRAWAQLAPMLIAEWVLSDCATPVDEFAALMGPCMPGELREKVDAAVLRNRNDE